MNFREFKEELTKTLEQLEQVNPEKLEVQTVLSSYLLLHQECHRLDMISLVHCIKDLINISENLEAFKSGFEKILHDRMKIVDRTVLSPWENPLYIVNQFCLNLYKLLFPGKQLIDYVRLLNSKVKYILETEIIPSRNEGKLSFTVEIKRYDLNAESAAKFLSSATEAKENEGVKTSEPHDIVVVGEYIFRLNKLLPLNIEKIKNKHQLITFYRQLIQELKKPAYKEILLLLLRNSTVADWFSQNEVFNATNSLTVQESIEAFIKVLLRSGEHYTGNALAAEKPAEKSLAQFQTYLDLFSQEQREKLEGNIVRDTSDFNTLRAIIEDLLYNGQCVEVTASRLKECLQNPKNRSLLVLSPILTDADKERQKQQLQQFCEQEKSNVWSVSTGNFPLVYLRKIFDSFNPVHFVEVVIVLSYINDEQTYQVLFEECPTILTILSQKNLFANALIQLSLEQTTYLINALRRQQLIQLLNCDQDVLSISDLLNTLMSVEKSKIIIQACLPLISSAKDFNIAFLLVNDSLRPIIYEFYKGYFQEWVINFTDFKFLFPWIPAEQKNTFYNACESILLRSMTTAKDLCGVLRHLNEEQCQQLCQACAEQLIQKPTDFAYVIDYFYDKRRVIIYEACKKRLPQLITSNRIFFEVFSYLSLEQSKQAVALFEDKLKEWIVSVDDLCSVLDRLLEEQQVIIYEACENHLIATLNGANDFFSLFQYSPIENAISLIDKFKNKLQYWIMSKEHFKAVLTPLTEEKRILVYELYKEKLFDSIINAAQLCDVAKYLKPQQRLELCEQFKLYLPSWIKSFHILIKTFETFIDDTDREILYDVCKSHFSRWITTPEQFSGICEFLSVDQCAEVSKCCKLRLSASITSLSQFFNLFPKSKIYSKCTIIFNEFKECLSNQELIKNSADLKNILEFLPCIQGIEVFTSSEKLWPQCIKSAEDFHKMIIFLDMQKKEKICDAYLSYIMPNVTEAMGASLKRLVLNKQQPQEQLQWLENYIDAFCENYRRCRDKQVSFFKSNILSDLEQLDNLIDKLIFIINHCIKEPDSRTARVVASLKNDSENATVELEKLGENASNPVLLAVSKFFKRSLSNEEELVQQQLDPTITLITSITKNISTR